MLPLFEAPDTPTAEPLIMISCMQFELDKQAMVEQLPLMLDEARQIYGDSEMNDISGYDSTWSARPHELRQRSSSLDNPRNGARGPNGFVGGCEKSRLKGALHQRSCLGVAFGVVISDIIEESELILTYVNKASPFRAISVQTSVRLKSS